MTSPAVATSFTSFVTLNDGNKMPLFGLGTFLMEDCSGFCKTALQKGYRLLDSATFYENEAEVGKAVRNSGLDRKDVFVVTKLRTDDHGKDKTKTAIETSLKLLDVGYIDLYLIHAPSGGKILETYDVIAEYQKKGLIKSIGVSNFGLHHLKGLAEAGRPTPAVNQIELHPWQRKDDIVEYCRNHGIAVMGFSPVAKGRKMDDPQVAEIAKRRNVSYAQVLIRWSVQRGFIAIPKTSKVQRLDENAEVFKFSLTEEDMAEMANLEQQSFMRSRVDACAWDP